MKSTKKCINCGNWSEWNNSLDNKCEHCGELLQKEKAQKQEQKRLEKFQSYLSLKLDSLTFQIDLLLIIGTLLLMV